MAVASYACRQIRAAVVSCLVRSKAGGPTAAQASCCLTSAVVAVDQALRISNLPSRLMSPKWVGDTRVASC